MCITKSVEVVYIRVDHQETPLPSHDDYLQLDENTAAVKIQAHYRGYRVRKMLKNHEESKVGSNGREQLYVTGNAVQLQREGNLKEGCNVEEYSESPLISMVAHIEDLNPHSEEQEESLKIGAARNEGSDITESVDVLPSVVVAQNVVEAALQEVRGEIKEREKGKETPGNFQKEHDHNVGGQEKELGPDNFNAHKELMDSATVQETITDDKPQEEENQYDQRNDTDEDKMQSSLQNHEEVADTKAVESSRLRDTEITGSQKPEQVDVVESQYPNEAVIEDSVIEDRHTSTEVEVPQVAE